MIPVPASRLFRFVSLRYLKSFLILLGGLSLAVVLIDYLQNAHRLPVGANLRLLYAFYTWETMLTLLYPLSILLAMAWTMVIFIRQNIFVALYSFGYSRTQLFRPFFLTALGIYLLFLGLQNTDFAYSRNRGAAILHPDRFGAKVENLFFKYNGDFVFVRQLDPVKKVLKDVTLFHLKGKKILSTLHTPRAVYRGDRWVAEEVTLRKKRFDERGEPVGFTEMKKRHYAMLEGYQPKVVKLIYEGRSLRISDALGAWKLLAAQGLDSSKIRASLFNLIVMPLFALALMPLLFFHVRPYRRFLSMERFWGMTLGVSLLVWAFLFAMYRLGMNGVVDPILGQLLPVGALILYALYDTRRQIRMDRFRPSRQIRGK